MIAPMKSTTFVLLLGLASVQAITQNIEFTVDPCSSITDLADDVKTTLSTLTSVDKSSIDVTCSNKETMITIAYEGQKVKDKCDKVSNCFTTQTTKECLDLAFSAGEATISNHPHRDCGGNPAPASSASKAGATHTQIIASIAVLVGAAAF